MYDENINLNAYIKGEDQFFTHPRLAAAIASWANIEPGGLVLEPSAGGGAFVDAVFAEEPSAAVMAVEIDRVLASRLERRYETSGMDLTVLGKDFLQYIPPSHEPAFDVCITNPPYGTRGKKTVGLGHRHVAHALDFAARVIALVPISFSYGKRAQDLIFSKAFVSRKVELINRPPFGGPDDKGEGARRDHMVIELKRYDSGYTVPAGMRKFGPSSVETERWYVEYD